MSRNSELIATAPWIACEDLKATVEYYRTILGFTGDWQWFWGEPPDHAGVSRDGVRILLVQDGARAARSRGSEIVIYVRSVIALYGELTRSGAKIVRPLGKRPWGTFDFTAVDPNGFELVFTEAPTSKRSEPDLS